MPHTMSPTIYYCKWCGKSLMELEDSSDRECHGTSGIFHINYLKAKKQFDIMMNPILNRIVP